MSMSSILDGMTLDEALGCLMPSIKNNGQPGGTIYFVHDSKVYVCPDCIGIMTKTGHCEGPCRACWESAITAHYAAQEAKKWHEPLEHWRSWIDGEGNQEHFYCRENGRAAEIARTNARRWLEEFARLNGGAGEYVIRKFGSAWVVIGKDSADLGEITFATREAAQYIIDNHAELLRLLIGGAE
jgi:hypothetical protein